MPEKTGNSANSSSNSSHHHRTKKNRAISSGPIVVDTATTTADDDDTVETTTTQKPLENGSGGSCDTASSPVPVSNEDDRTNPQQGAQKPQQPKQFSTNNTNMKSAPPTAEESKTTTKATSTSTTTTTTTTTKIPPTIKDDRKIFVGGLPSDVTPEEFLQCFEQFGTVIDSVIMYDRVTTRSRGFGFITFENPHICQQLIQMKRIPMRSDKYVEIKEAQPRENTATATNVSPNMMYTLHNNKYRRNGSGDVGMIMSHEPFVSGMVMGEPSTMMMDPSSYMTMTQQHQQQYGPMSDMPSSPSMGRARTIDYMPYPTNDTRNVGLQPQFYVSNGHYHNGFVADNNIATSDEMGPTTHRYMQHSPMSPSNVVMSYGDPYIPNYGMDHTYMTNGATSDEHSSHPPPPPVYSMPMPPQYYNHPYQNNNSNNIPPPSPPEMTNNLDSPHRINHHTIVNNPYDPSTLMHLSPTRSFYMPLSFSYVPSLHPPLGEESKTMELSSPPFVPTENHNPVVEHRSSQLEEPPTTHTNNPDDHTRTAATSSIVSATDQSSEINDNLNFGMNNLELNE